MECLYCQGRTTPVGSVNGLLSPGSPGVPGAYIDLTGRTPVVRLLGSRSPDDTLEWFSAWCIPETDATDRFHFPKGLYGALVSSVVACIADGSA